MKRTLLSRLLLLLLLLALLASAALNWLIFAEARSYYLQLNATRLDPLGLSAYPLPAGEPNTVTSGKTRVVLFGDSRAAEWPMPDLPQFDFVNRGIGAQTSAQVQQRFPHHVKPLNPDVVIIQVGINDLKTIALFPQRRPAIIADCQENVAQIVTQARNIGATVILTTIFPAGEVPIERRLFWSAGIYEAIDEVNRYIHTLAAADVLIFDAYSLLADENGLLPQAYATDELHLNAAGYELLNQELVPLLANLQ